MSDRSRTLIKRLKRIDGAIFPPGSVAANIRNLSPHDRAIFDEHKRKCSAWTKERPGEQAYTDLLAGEFPPELPHYLYVKIYPTYSEELSAEANYLNFVERLRCN